MKTAFLYSDEFANFDYGASHPLKTMRLKLTYELIEAYGLLSLPNTRIVTAETAAEEDARSFHEADYLRILKASNSGIPPPGSAHFGIGPGDNPAFKGLYDWSMLVLGAALRAAAMVDRGETDIAFSISGGLHHAMPAMASGFCYINDPVIAIMSLLKRGRRVAYVDIDAHHADGVQEAFYKTDKVLTISIHETGKLLFPGTGFAEETGEGDGRGFCVNVPMPPYADDEIFLYVFDQVVTPMIVKFGPDVVVSQLGVDSFRADPLAHLNYTNYGFCEAVKRIKEVSPKWVALGGGGYDVANVAKAWTLAWGIMNDAAIPDEIPAAFLSSHPHSGLGGRIRDERFAGESTGKEERREEVKKTVEFIQKEVFPLMGI